MIEISTTSKMVILGVAVPTALGLLYFLWKTGRDEDDDSDKDKQSIVTTRQTVIEVSIPRKVVGSIIGRQGANIKELQERTGVRMNFKEDGNKGDGDRLLVIRGSAMDAQSAECLIREMIADLPVLVQGEFQVPKYTLGRIIGRGGETVRQLSRTSKCKIYIDKSRGGNPNQLHLITLTGTQDQILFAKTLLQEKVDEENKVRAEMAVCAANREKREPRIQSEDSKIKSQSHVQNHCGDNVCEDWDKDTSGESYLYLTFPEERKFVDVYVSAIADMEHFWVQTIGPMALQLDRLSQQMTCFYENEGQKLKISSVKKGDIIAAPFENDNTWYRAKVMEVNDSKLDVFYVDYGDSAFIECSCARLIKEDFLNLPFQAIECCLSGVKPNGEWSEAAFDKFETLTHCAKWKVVVAEAKQFTGSIPHLVLVDTNGTEDVNINEELIEAGYAVPNK